LKSLRTRAVRRPLSVDAPVRASVSFFLCALVHVVAVPVCVLYVSVPALAVRRAGQVDAVVVALEAAAVRALVHVQARLPVFLKLEALGAKAEYLCNTENN
jgi:hypothetical protein